MRIRYRLGDNSESDSRICRSGRFTVDVRLRPRLSTVSWRMLNVAELRVVRRSLRLVGSLVEACCDGARQLAVRKPYLG